LDPPLRVVGDEIANIAPLPKLPELATDARGFGIQLVLALQSLPQAERRWGQAGARALVENMPAQLLLGGITDAATLSRYSQLLGHIDTKTVSEQFDPATGRPAATGTHTTQRPVMAPDALRTLPTGQAVLIHRNHPPVALHPVGWHNRPDATELRAAAARTRRTRTTEDPTRADPT
jgi:type IV secretory pathway TraG/TraD family ATPase VirD4